MQKAQNVTRIIPFLITFFIFNKAQCQEKLNGRYSCLAPLQEHYNVYSFDRNNRFEYNRGASLGDDYYGSGEYKLIGNKLILNYNKTKPLKIGLHSSKVWTNNKDSINVNFKILNFDSIALPYASIAYKDSLSKYGYSGVAANEKGIASINLKRERTNLQFKISNLGFRQYEFAIDTNYSYDISIFLQKDGEGLPILNQIDTLIIDKKRPKYFTVKNKNGSISTWKKLDD